MCQVPVSISVYVVLFIVLLRGRFGGLSTAPVAFRGGGRTCDGCSFGSVLGQLADWFCCVPDVHLANRMPSATTWRICPLRFPTQGVGWLRDLACGRLDMVEC